MKKTNLSNVCIIKYYYNNINEIILLRSGFAFQYSSFQNKFAQIDMMILQRLLKGDFLTNLHGLMSLVRHRANFLIFLLIHCLLNWYDKSFLNWIFFSLYICRIFLPWQHWVCVSTRSEMSVRMYNISINWQSCWSWLGDWIQWLCKTHPGSSFQVYLTPWPIYCREQKRQPQPFALL